MATVSYKKKIEVFEWSATISMGLAFISFAVFYFITHEEIDIFAHVGTIAFLFSLLCKFISSCFESAEKLR